ncbi:MAG: DHH family phosphoesterase [Thermoguttaceae bacterium]
MVTDWSRFVEIVRTARRVVLTAHVRPDGDCIGSEIAMALILESLGKEVRIVNPQRTPPTLAPLDETGRIRAVGDLTNDENTWLDAADLLIVLDTRSWQQLDAMRPVIERVKATKVVIDHHEFGDAIADAEFIDTSAEATGRIVFEASQALGVTLTRPMAEAIMAALTTDTGWFRFSSVNAGTFTTAAALVAAGARVDHLYRILNEQESIGRMRLIGRTLSKIESHLDGRLMVVCVTRDDIAAAGALASDTEDIVNMTLQIRGSNLAIMISELADGKHKVSFRSRCGVDCSVLAKQFGGGGHRSAAGATITMSLEETKATVIRAITDAVNAAA